MNEYIKKIIYYLLQYRRIDDTRSFKRLMHNKDLCPIVQQKIDNVLNGYEKYRTITYDIQGFKDEGSDVVIRLSNDDETKYICFQIKSNNDLKDKDYLMKLKAQANDTKMKYGTNLGDYYILVCCDLTSEGTRSTNKNKLRQIEAAFSSTNDIHVIEPSYVLGFIRLSPLQVDVILKNKIDEQDVILKEAISTVIDLTPTERALLYYMIYNKIFINMDSIDQSDILNANFINDTYERVEDYERDWFFSDDSDFEIEEYDVEEYKRYNRVFKERVLNDLEYLSNYFINCEISNKYKLDINTTFPILTLMLDGYIRYNYSDTELLNYIMMLLPGMKGYEL